MNPYSVPHSPIVGGGSPYGAPAPVVGGTSPYGTPATMSSGPYPNVTPAQAASIQPGSITYTTTVGPDGNVIYHPFKCVSVPFFSGRHPSSNPML